MADMMTIRQFCQELGMSEASYHRLRAAGNGPAVVRINTRNHRILRSEFERWLQARTDQAGTEAKAA